jgi:hypothetical protein
MEMKPQTIWAAVVIVLILVAGAVTLVALDKDVTIILSLAAVVALPVLSAFGVAFYQKLEQVKEQGNGNVSKLLEAQQKTQEQLANLAMILPSLTQTQINQVKTASGDDGKSNPDDDQSAVRVSAPWDHTHP